MPGISASAGWARACWSRRNNSVESRGIRSSHSCFASWKCSRRPRSQLSKGGKLRKVGYTRAATFNGKSDVPADLIEFFYPNGHFRSKKMEWLSYVSGTRKDVDGSGYLAPTSELPKSHTEGDSSMR